MDHFEAPPRRSRPRDPRVASLVAAALFLNACGDNLATSGRADAPRFDAGLRDAPDAGGGDLRSGDAAAARPSFVGARSYSVVGGSRSVTARDFNSDGTTDLAIASLSGRIEILFGTGDGGLVPAWTVDVGTSELLAMATGDLDGDGRLDFVTAAGTDGIVSVALAGGGGDFTTSRCCAVGATVRDIAVADVNGDAILDLIAPGYSSGLAIAHGNGDGTFAAPRFYPVGAYPQALAVADLNGDKKPEIVVVGSGVTIVWSANDSWEPAALPVPLRAPSAVVAADVDGDGAVDLVVGDWSAGLVILYGTGDGTFGAPVRAAVGLNVAGLGVARIDDDESADLIVVNQSQANLSILRGRENRGFAAEESYAVGSYSAGLALADFDGDGLTDLAVGDGGGASVMYRLATGGVRGAPRAGPCPGAKGVVVEDLNGDRWPDLVAFGDSICVVLAEAPAVFAIPALYAAGRSPWSGDATDLDGDAIPDLVALDYEGNGMNVLLGLGGGHFAPPVSYATGDGPISVTAVDLNEDQLPDLAVANWRGDDLSIFLGRGDGTFGAGSRQKAGDGPWQIVGADFDSDGHQDLATANFHDVGTQNVGVLFGRGDGTFAAQTFLAVPGRPEALAAADLDADGHTDLVVTDFGGQYVNVLLGQGNGDFAPSRGHRAGAQPNGVAVADFDLDGRVDLATAGNLAGSVSVLPGLGSAAWGEPVGYGTGNTTWAVVAADLNVDGLPDLVASAANGLVILLNDTDL